MAALRHVIAAGLLAASSLGGCQAPQGPPWTADHRLGKLVIGRDIRVVRERLGRIGRSPEAREEMNVALRTIPPQRGHPDGPRIGVEMARLLVAHGADVDNFPASERRTPVLNAVARLYPELLAFLLEKGADPNRSNKGSGTPLGLAVCPDGNYSLGGFHEYARIYGYYRNPPSQEEAVRRSNLCRRIVALLLDAGADPEKPSRLRDVPYLRACYWGEAQMVRHMLRKGARPNLLGPAQTHRYDDKRGYRPLHCAALRNSEENVEVVRILLEAGADPRLKDGMGRTPLELARQKGNWRVAKALGG